MSDRIITISQELDLLADEFSFDTPYFTKFLNADEDITISQGYEGNNINLTGKADEWNISLSNSEFSLSVRGRDNMKQALETQFQKTYFLYQPSVEPRTKYDEPIPYEVGETMASAVAQQACTMAGLAIVWDCPDYPVVNAVEPSNGFNESAAEAIKKLIEPFQHTEMFRVDVYASDNTVYVKKRRYPYAVDYSIALTDAKIGSFSLAKTNYKDGMKIRNIYVSREEPVSGTTILERSEHKIK